MEDYEHKKQHPKKPNANISHTKKRRAASEQEEPKDWKRISTSHSKATTIFIQSSSEFSGVSFLNNIPSIDEEFASEVDNDTPPKEDKCKRTSSSKTSKAVSQVNLENDDMKLAAVSECYKHCEHNQHYWENNFKELKQFHAKYGRLWILLVTKNFAHGEFHQRWLYEKWKLGKVSDFSR